MLKKKSVIPIIGSGFSRGSKANKGTVPSGEDMSNFMLSEIQKIDNKSRLPNVFSKIATYYESKVPLNIRDKYLKDNFTNVKLERYKKNFLSIWPTLYTLNIDDGIENSIDGCEIFLPNNNNYNLTNFNESQVVIKLHGDAKNVLKYSNDKKIFTKRQYFNSLTSNSKLLSIFREDYYNKNIIYIGCSLDDENDLYSVIGDIENNKVITKKYYVTSNKNLDDYYKNELEEYGVTDIIVVDDYMKFYSEVYELYNETDFLVQELNCFNNPQIIIKPKGHNQNFDYLCYTFNANIDNNTIELPHFFISRTIIEIYIDNLNKYPFTILEGNRVSGKTYALLDIIHKIRDRSIYFFPSSSSISFDILELLLNKKNSIILFDSNSINQKQINFLENRIDRISVNNNNILVAVNTSDKDILTTFNYRVKDIEPLRLENKFDEKEIDEINRKLSLSDLLIFDKSKTVFDNLIISTKDCSSYLTNIDDEKQYSIEELVIFIILATKDKIYDSELLKYGLIDSIGQLNKKIEPIIQFDYTEWFQNEHRSLNKVIPNAKVWILQLLGNHSRTPKDKTMVADAYDYLAKHIKERNSDEIKYFKTMSKYINFDVINEVFPSEEKGVIDLIIKIYDTLHDYLADDPQYFHQISKAYLWLYQDELDKLQTSLKYAKKAAHDLAVKRNIKSDSNC